MRRDGLAGGRAVKWVGVLALVAVLPGCELWNGWLDMLKWKGAGAKSQQKTLANAGPDAVQPGAAGAGQIMIPRVTVFRITMPIGSFSGNDQVWSQLNEDALDSRTAVLMAQNGLRAATGTLARWPAIAKLLDAPGSTTDQQLYQTNGESSVNVTTRAGVTDQIVVSVDRDLQQQGRTFERCDNGFRLSMRGMRGKPELQVQLEPIVTLGTVSVVRTGTDMGVTRSAFSSEESFGDLRMGATLTADQFLVVSAMDPKTSPFSVGTLWLSDKEKAPPTETVLVFVPAPAQGPPAKSTASK
jgi:hypothetical protein